MSSEQQGPEDRWTAERDETEIEQQDSPQPWQQAPGASSEPGEGGSSQQRTSSWPPSDQSPMGWEEPPPPVHQPGAWQPPGGAQQAPGQLGAWQQPSAGQGQLGAQEPGWQPPATAWQPPPGSTWGQQQWSPGAQPGWGAADYLPPQGPHGSSPLAIIAAIALMVIGAFLLLIAVFAIVFAAAGSAFLEQYDPTLSGMGSAVTAVFLVVFGVLLVISLLHIASAIGIFVHKSWARWMGIVLAVIGLLLGLLALLAYADDPFATAGELAIVVVWLGAYGLAVVGLAAGGRHFTRQPSWR